MAVAALEHQRDRRLETAAPKRRVTKEVIAVGSGPAPELAAESQQTPVYQCNCLMLRGELERILNPFGTLRQAWIWTIAKYE